MVVLTTNLWGRLKAIGNQNPDLHRQYQDDDLRKNGNTHLFLSGISGLKYMR